jgi:outer membrane biosynthesis protein TonB
MPSKLETMTLFARLTCATLLMLNLAIGIGTLHLQAQTGTPGALVQAGPPLYPLAAKAAGIEGKVVLRGIIDADGHMKNLQV